jgi:coenzyme PQQ synthesis protein D (PqqD)
MIDQATRIRRNPDVVFRQLEEEQGGVLLHLESGEYHGLNDMGSLIWRLIENETTFAAVVDGVRAEAEDVPAGVDQDVSNFLDDLNRRNLVELLP